MRASVDSVMAKTKERAAVFDMQSAKLKKMVIWFCYVFIQLSFLWCALFCLSVSLSLSLLLPICPTVRLSHFSFLFRFVVFCHCCVQLYVRLSFIVSPPSPSHLLLVFLFLSRWFYYPSFFCSSLCVCSSFTVFPLACLSIFPPPFIASFCLIHLNGTLRLSICLCALPFSLSTFPFTYSCACESLLYNPCCTQTEHTFS